MSEPNDAAMLARLRDLKKGWVTSRSFSKFIDQVCDRIATKGDGQ